jgi:hypothetical protein
MSWQDQMKTMALAALAERPTTTAPAPTTPFAVDTRRTWDANEVWLSRVRPPRDFVARPSTSELPTQLSQDITARR